MSDIVERLDQDHEWIVRQFPNWSGPPIKTLSGEARDEIVRLNDIAMGLQTLSDQQALEIERLRAEVEEARANSMSNWGQRERAEAAEADADWLRAERDEMERRARAFEAGATNLQAERDRLREALQAVLDEDGAVWSSIARAALGDKP